MKRRLVTALLLAGVHLCNPATANADSIPTHGLVTHLPQSEEFIAPFSAGRTWMGSDDLDDTDAIWHHEILIDVLGIEPGVYPVSVNGGPLQFRVFGDSKPDIYVDFHQPDAAGGFPGVGVIPGLGRGNTCIGAANAETGSLCKQNINLTKFGTVWAISVAEGPGPSAGLVNGSLIKLKYNGVRFDVCEISSTPEPASVVLVGSTMAGLLVRRKKSSIRLFD